MAAAIPYIIAAATVVSTISTIRQGQAVAQQQQAATQATVTAATFNEQVNTQNADIVRSQAQAQAVQNDRETFLRLGAIRAAAGKSGGVSSEGSALDVLGDAAAQSELDRQNIIYQGELQARGFTNSATLDRYTADSAAARPTTDMSPYYMKAGSELLQGGASAYTSYKRLN